MINPAVLAPDPIVDPYLATGDVFVMGRLHGKINKQTPHYDKADLIFFPQDFNVWGEEINQGDNFGDTHWGNTFYIFKIMNDSIFESTKGIYDIEDFELIDVYGDPINEGFSQIAGRDVDGGGWTVTRKPNIYKGVTEVGAGFGTNAEDSDWIVVSNTDDGGIPNDDMSAGIGAHIMDPVTVYVSTVTSTTYIVSDGYTGEQTIDGVVTGTTVAEFTGNLIKAHDEQSLVVVAGTRLEKDPTDVVNDGDKLIVTSTDEKNVTEYIVL